MGVEIERGRGGEKEELRKRERKRGSERIEKKKRKKITIVSKGLSEISSMFSQPMSSPLIRDFI